MLLKQRPQGKIIWARAGSVQELLHAMLPDMATGGRVRLVPHDLTPACGVAKQLPVVTVGDARMLMRLVRRAMTEARLA